jgi:protein-S-isoprenylcysteine O-methyltransferase Ste14
MSFVGLLQNAAGLLLALCLCAAVIGAIVFCIIFFSVRAARKRRANEAHEEGREQ